jgi:transposase
MDSDPFCGWNRGNQAVAGVVFSSTCFLVSGKTVCKKQFAIAMFSDILDTLWPLKQPRRELMDTVAESLLTRDEMESRRLLAAEDLQTGLKQAEVARKFGVSRTTASRWQRALSGRGVEALRKRRAPGRPSRLNSEQLGILSALYREGPRAAGLDADRWTTMRFADAIFLRFSVRYDPDHVGRILHRLGLRERKSRPAPEPRFVVEQRSGISLAS